jgi:hypothetical protein
MQEQPTPRKPGRPRGRMEDRYTECDGGWGTPCWRDLRPLAKTGYGRQITLPDGRQVQPHRAYYEHFVGPIPDGMELDHLCKNLWCVNPGHLEPVTHTENIRRAAGTKLNRESVLRIHALRAEGLSYAQIARHVEVQWSAVRSVLKGYTWRDVYDEVHATGDAT